jgi:hypothetical protein
MGRTPGKPPVLLSPELIQQLRSLFGTSVNAHERLGLGQLVPLAHVMRGMSGWPVSEVTERLIVARWAEWRAEFLRDPKAVELEAEQTARMCGDFYHTLVRDPVTERLTFPVKRFTLADNPSKWLTVT